MAPSGVNRYLFGMTDDNLGFDLETAIEKLSKALEAEGVPMGDGPEWAAIEHAGLHNDIIVSERCPDFPCRKAALSFALLELLEYKRESSTNLRKLADRFDRLAADLSEVEDSHSSVIRALFVAEKAAFDRLPPQLPRNDARLKCEAILDRMAALAKASMTAAEVLRDELLSPQLRQSARKLPGRPSQPLLVAASQQLRNWGIGSAKEIADLLPDDQGKHRENSPVKRAEKRSQKREDWTSVGPTLRRDPGNETAKKK
jgi:hypothetical protein